MSANRIRLLFVLAFIAFAAPARAQTATLTGKITGAEGKPLAGAVIQALAGSTPVATAQSDEAGNYRLTVPSAGSYIIKIRRIGYALLTRDNLSIGGGGTSTVDFSLSENIIQLDMVVTAASRAPEKIIDAPASVSVVGTTAVEERAAINVADHVVAQQGIDVARGGIARSNIVARGFNNIFSGALMTLTDNRFAFVPSLRVNIPYLSTTTNEDIDHVEIVLGPGAALYGPNTASGVMSITTKSPFATDGTTLTLDGGNQNVLRGGFRSAWILTPKIAVKASYDVFHGKEWDFVKSDTVGEQKSRDRDVDRRGGELRVDFRPTAASEVIATYGRTDAANAVEPTGLGPAQVHDWKYETMQLRGRYKSLFAQVFMNTSNAGGTFLLTAVRPTTNCPDVQDPACIIDRSRQIAAQIQHGLTFGSRQRFVYGIDHIRTMPKTDNTINGRNEQSDNITETGGYVHSVTDISKMLQLTAAARVDKHSRLEDPVFSPRLALVFKPIENQNFRLTYNRAFSTPSTLNLSLDLEAARIPSSGTKLFGVRALGVPESGLTFRRDCTGGIGGLCMRIPTAFGGNPGTPVPAQAALLYKAAFGVAGASLVAALSAPGTGLSAAQAQGIISFLASQQPTPAEVGTKLRVLNSANQTFADVLPTDLRDVARLKPTTHSTIEGGYKGIIGQRFQISLDVWHENRKNFVGPLIVETPNVFLDAATLGAFIASKLPAVGLSPAQIGALAPLVAGALGGVSGTTNAAAKGVPLAVVNFNEANSSGSDVILTYRNFGNLNLWGSDLGTELLLDGGFSIAGTYSYVNKNLFPRSEVGGVQDISLNAPANKHTVTVRYRNDQKGFGGEIRERHVDGFQALSFISANIKAYTLIDAGVHYRPPAMDNFLFSVNATNLADKKHQEFAQGGLIGRLVMGRVSVTF